MTRTVSRALQPLCTSTALGKDWIPRLSVAAFERMRDPLVGPPPPPPHPGMKQPCAGVLHSSPVQIHAQSDLTRLTAASGSTLQLWTTPT